MKKFLFYSVIVLSSALIEGSLFADMVYLKSGGKVEGVIQKETDEEIIISIRVGTVSYPRHQIKSISKSSNEENAKLIESWKTQKKENEKNQQEWTKFAAEQKAKGLILHDGQWITRDEYRELTSPKVSYRPYGETKLSEVDDKEVIGLISSSTEFSGSKLPLVYLLIDRSYIIGNDGLDSIKEHVLVKILNDSGTKAGDILIPYNSYFQELQVIKARTICADGSVIDVSKEAMQDKTFYSAYPVYSDSLIRQISFPAVKPGNVIEYEVILKDKKPIMGKAAFDTFEFPFGCLTQHARLKITLPKNVGLKFTTSKLTRGTPFIGEEGNNKTYLWQMEDIFPDHGYETLKPPYREICPYIFFTTVASWDNVADWFRDLTKGQAVYDDTIKNKTLELTGKGKSKEESIKALYYFVSQKIRYVGIELQDSAFKPYRATDVLTNQYGDCKGKATLLISMLKALNTPAYYALLSTRTHNPILLDYPSLDFNHCIVAIPRGDDFLFLDPTSGLCGYGQLSPADYGTDILVIRDQDYKFKKSPITKSEDNVLTTTTWIVFKGETDASITEETIMKGGESISSRALAKYSSNSYLRDLLSKHLNIQSSNTKLNNLTFSDVDDFENSFECRYGYRVKDFANKSGELIMFSIPFERVATYSSLFGTEERKYPVRLAYPYIDERIIVVALPQGYKIKYLPEDITLDTEFASYTKRSATKENTLIIKRQFVLRADEISPSKVIDFKNMVDRINTEAKKNIILEKISK